ncbi:MAG: alpha/beta hydrolase [Proteobacteria bacterium]|nr:alpha/beta hydrolase [Pseudomonadota bacterium]MBU1386693.1 alpha/beta hydrolase [Pseudomonadota bacterium]MBU1543304.1 alpha/beta hydrolase [Pseudomonadota bacterium]MBU2429948.1 alpha/beta hydrolase [Pseudomonadota bacterium]MBU2483135.1 alpha/beta hydrolase [Pseudomonadota bacterium]
METLLAGLNILTWLLPGLVFSYLLLSLILTYVVQQIPRNPVDDIPDWGHVTDTIIPAIDGRSLEVWRIEPDAESRGIVVFAHGWGRNRGRMVERARQFARWGFTTVIHSARDHGNSSPKRLMNALRFSEDIEAVMKWINEPVLLYGHSAGSAGAIIAAFKNPSMVRLLFLEASYAYTREALLSLYRWVNPVFGNLFGPMIVLWMRIFYGKIIHEYSPGCLAEHIQMPVMIIHGQNDRRFPLTFAEKLKEKFKPDQVCSYFAKNAGHSDSSQTPGYPAAVKSFIDQYL